MTTKAGTRLQVTIKPDQMRKLDALRSNTYMTYSQTLMLMIDAFYRKRFGTDVVESTQEYSEDNY